MRISVNVIFYMFVNKRMKMELFIILYKNLVHHVSSLITNRRFGGRNQR